jgi:bifunctional DNase/RNase
MRAFTGGKWTTIRRVGRGIVRIGVVTFILTLSASSCKAREKEEVKTEETVAVEVLKVGVDSTFNLPVVLLQNKGKTKVIPIWVGPLEAQAIAMEIEGVTPPRPLTHDLLKTILQDVGVAFEKALVSELKERTYYARIYLTSAGKQIEVDSRASDAIALALRFHKPIFVAKAVMDGETAFDMNEARSQATATKVHGISVQDITRELAAYFGLSGEEGVLVSEAKGEADTSGLKRGDVILAVEGEKVRGVTDFKEQIAKRKGQEVTLRVQREGKVIVVRLPTEN